MGLRQLFVTCSGTTAIGSLKYNNTQNDVAQSYTCTESGLLGAIRPLMLRLGNPIGNVYVEVYSGETIGSGSLLGTSNSIDLSTISAAANVYPVFTFSTDITQVLGQQYWFRFISTSSYSTTNYLSIRGNNTNVYAGGTAGYSSNLDVWTTSANDLQIYIFNKTSILYANFISGNDTTGSGDILAPVKTLHKALEYQLQGDEVRIMENETRTAEVVLPVRNGRYYPNSIVGVNSLGAEDGTQRAFIASSLAIFSSPPIGGLGNTYHWLFKNLEFRGFTGILFNTSTSWNYGGSTFYNCKFKSLVQISTSNLSSWTTFQKCTFEDIAQTSNLPIMGNTAFGGSFINCTFRRCSTTSTSYNLVFAWNLIDCMFIDCSSSRYGPSATIAMINVVVDRYVFTGTGDADNVLTGYTYTSAAFMSVHRNILITNVQYANTNGLRVLFSAGTSLGLLGIIENIAYWNCSNAVPYFKTTNWNLIVSSADNAFIELTESPWKNDDGVIANPMACYEYKDGYPWRRKNQLLTDVSGWSYPT